MAHNFMDAEKREGIQGWKADKEAISKEID
jgi:hypothetical protein